MTKTRFANWPEFEAYLDQLGLFRMQPGLDRMQDALRQSGLTRPPYPVIQGVGTNGKGSTCTFLASLAAEAGLCCGLHSSPHFVSVRERVRLFRPGGPAEGALMPEAAWLEAANEALALPAGPNLTYFELVTLLALMLLRRAGVDLAVMESGLGGSFDATTALEVDLAFFTPIDLDHRDVLGTSLADIAADKAGALRPGLSAISARQQPEARHELEKRAAQVGVPLKFIPGGGPEALAELLEQPDQAGQADRADQAELAEQVKRAGQTEQAGQTGGPRQIELGLTGRHQFENAALAVEVWREFEKNRSTASITPVAASSLKRGLRRAWLPGRLQKIPARLHGNAACPPHPALLLDGAHNRHGLAALGKSLAGLKTAPLVTIFACLRDKEPEKLLPHLRVLATGSIIVPEIPGHPRAMPAAELAALIGPQARPATNLAEAMLLARGEIVSRLGEDWPEQPGGWPLLVCGSLYLLAEFFKIYPAYLQAPAEHGTEHKPGHETAGATSGAASGAESGAQSATPPAGGEKP